MLSTWCRTIYETHLYLFRNLEIKRKEAGYQEKSQKSKLLHLGPKAQQKPVGKDLKKGPKARRWVPAGEKQRDRTIPLFREGDN